ncbi:MAG: bifunctional glutamate N-acetyltransferase/amino-acid acetyltransferase ArgJ [Deltaproteobacteria bacterium]|nr:bifunctional glutamate N-acetyltransferase/amino-acid acetyltransferase ArgJ [Deltaproteobacteria bacterium]
MSHTDIELACPGFKAASVAAGLKKTGADDLGLIFSETEAAVAGVFTRNLVKAAPVVLDQLHLKSGVCRAIVANSGCANCSAGEEGMRAALQTVRLASVALHIPETQVMVASTGVIGKALPVEKVGEAFPGLVKNLDPMGLDAFSRAIMTTDKAPKTAARRVKVKGGEFTVTGVAKGAGMIRPDMATMLCFVMTDIKASQAQLQDVLKKAIDQSFNCITVDGDTSTNDTVLLLANGVSGIDVSECVDEFQEAVNQVTLALAKMMAGDGEGATKLFAVKVVGAESDEAARKVADTIAHSQLVKTAVFGADANWGRIVAAAGRAGVPLDPDRMDVSFDEAQLVKNGLWCGEEAEKAATAVMKKDEFDITVNLNMGPGKSLVYTCDLTFDYVRINADYRS